MGDGEGKVMSGHVKLAIMDRAWLDEGDGKVGLK